MKKIWDEGRCALNGWLSIPSAFSAEILAAQGYDSISIDLQHGIIDYQAAVGMLQAMRASDVVPIVRVPWLDPTQDIAVYQLHSIYLDKTSIYYCRRQGARGK